MRRRSSSSLTASLNDHRQPLHGKGSGEKAMAVEQGQVDGVSENNLFTVKTRINAGGGLVDSCIQVVDANDRALAEYGPADCGHHRMRPGRDER